MQGNGPAKLRLARPSSQPSAQEELADARKLEELEIQYWAVILSEPAVYDQVRGAILSALPDIVEDLRDLLTSPENAALAAMGSDTRVWSAVANRLATHLQSNDRNRTAIRSAHALVRSLSGRQGYCQRVDAALARQLDMKNWIVSRHLKLVVDIARCYRFPHMSQADLMQEGTLGLMKAVERFDRKRGVRFATYASWWVRHAIRRAAAEQSRTVRIPVHMVEASSAVARARALLETSADTASVEALVQATGLSERKVLQAQMVKSRELPLDAPVGAQEATSYLDLLECTSSDDPVEMLSNQQHLNRLPSWLKCLRPLEAQIVRLRFGLGESESRSALTLREIGDKYGLSRERIRQVEEQALQRIRSQMSDAD